MTPKSQPFVGILRFVPFELKAFVARWPYAYHLTSDNNIASICGSGRLESASTLLIRAGCQELLRQKRTRHTPIRVNGMEFSLRDQVPLREGNAALKDGWQFSDLIEALNRLVFFWPGGAVGPNDYGRRHFEHYKHEKVVIIRVPMPDLFALNVQVAPLFCAFNSGSPRWSAGKPSPRGAETFLPASRFSLTPSRVVELTFPDGVRLPATAKSALSPDGPWTTFSI